MADQTSPVRRATKRSVRLRRSSRAAPHARTGGRDPDDRRRSVMKEFRTRSAVALMVIMLAATMATPADAGVAATLPFFETIDCPRFVTAGRLEDGFDAPIELTCGYL